MIDEQRFDQIERSGILPVRMAGQSPTEGNVSPPAPSWQWALLTHVGKFDEADSTKHLYAYVWKPATIDEHGRPVESPTGGSSFTFARIVKEEDTGGTTGYATLVSPANGESIPFTDQPTTTITFQRSAITTPGATHWALIVGTTEGGTDIYEDLNIALGTDSVAVPGIPTDGTTFYVELQTHAGATVPYVRYECSLALDALAVHQESINWITSETLRGPVGGKTEDDDPWQSLDDPLVRLWSTIIGGKAYYVFQLPEIEWWGRIVDAPGGSQEFEDGRYWVQLQRLTVGGTDPRSLFEFSPRLENPLTVPVNNISETHDTELHGLEVGQFVRVRQTRGGEDPHLPRYWIEAGGATGFTATFNVIQNVCFDEHGCVSGVVRITLEFQNGLLKQVDPWPIPPCP